jgi:hypothetical protein
MTPGLGPPRPAQHDLHLSTQITQTVAAIRSRSRSPNGVAKRFPDWTAVGFRASRTPPIHQLAPTNRIRTTSRTLFLGSHALRGHSWPTCDTLGPTHRLSEDSLLAGRCITCGDLNPICLPDPLGSISSGWPDRWPPTSALPAFHCFAGPSLQRSRSHLREPFSSFAVHFRVRRREEIYRGRARSPKESTLR